VRSAIAEAVRERGRALRGLAAWKCDALQELADDIESGELVGIERQEASGG